MKNLFKVFGIVALVVVIGCFMVGCGDAEDGPMGVPTPATVTLEDGTAGDNKVILALSNGSWNSAYMSFMTGANAVAPFSFGSSATGIAASWAVKGNTKQAEITFTGINYSGTVSLNTGALTPLKQLMQGVSETTMSGPNMVNLVVTSGGNTFVAVDDIVDLPTITLVNTQLPLAGTVQPSDATNKTIVWSGGNVGNGIFNATSNGTFQVTAVISNGTSESTPFTKTFNIKVYIADLHDYDGTWKRGTNTIIMDGNNWTFTESTSGAGFKGIIVKLEDTNNVEYQVTSRYDSAASQWVPHYWYSDSAVYTISGGTLTINAGFELADGTYIKQ